MGNVFYFGWEKAYMVWIQHLGESGIFHTILLALNNFFSMLGEETICVAVMGLVYWGISKEKGRRIGIVVIAANISNGMIKNIFKRLRPYQVLNDVNLLREVGGYSFPSGHSANAAALYPTTAYEFKNKKWLKYMAIIVPICVAISRNFLGAHWPTDVLVGLLQGIAIFLIVELLSSKINNKYIVYGILLLVGFFGMFYCKTTDYFNSYGMMVGVFFGTLFEERFVNFENTKKVSLMLLRTIFGAVVYLGCNALIKAAIGGIFVEDTMGYFLMRVIRYALVVFILLGIYPMAFRLEKKIFKNS
ncbi:MAG: phosphatase PAP2 family protein [Lachnospiraceae bacterium]|nr:phosphatase PAP2 family protein [Lachnospiraceae bacterium]